MRLDFVCCGILSSECASTWRYTVDRTSVIIGSTVVIGLGLIAFWATISRPPAADAAPLIYIENTEELSRYVDLPRLGILTSENFVGHRIRVIEGTVSNLSDRTLRSVELRLSFNSFDGGIVLESEEEALRVPLPPGEARRFTFRFENLPTGWNYRVPDIEVLRVGY
jgi:hypothetical protein